MSANVGIEITNLDDMSVDPKDYATAAAVYKTMAQFCERKQRAMELRLNGAIDAAEEIDEELHRIWKTLPKWAQW